MLQKNYSLLSDKILISLVIDHDTRAFDEVYNRYCTPLFNYLIKMLADEQLAEDLLQNIFVSFWERRRSFSKIDSLGGYLFKCAKFQAIDFIRLQIKKRSFEEKYDLCQEQPSPLELQVAKELANFIDTCIKAMPPKTREIYELSRLELLNHKAIAMKLQISPTTVKKQINNALKFFRCKLSATPFRNNIFLLLFFLLRDI